MSGQPTTTEPDLRHVPIPTGFVIVSARDQRGLAAHTADDQVNFAVADENGEGTHTALTSAQTTLAATELLRITGANLAEYYITEGAYPALHHVPPGSEGREGHLVVFTGGDDSLLDLVQAAADHTCENHAPRKDIP